MNKSKIVVVLTALGTFGFWGTNAFGEPNNSPSQLPEEVARENKAKAASEPDVIFHDCIYSIAYDYVTDTQSSNSTTYPIVSVYFAQSKIKLRYQLGSDEVEVFQRFAPANSPILTDERPLKSYKLEGGTSLDDYSRWQFFLEPFLEATRAGVEIGGKLPQQNAASEVVHIEVLYSNQCN